MSKSLNGNDTVQKLSLTTILAEKSEGLYRVNADKTLTLVSAYDGYLVRGAAAGGTVGWEPVTESIQVLCYRDSLDEPNTFIGFAFKDRNCVAQILVWAESRKEAQQIANRTLIGKVWNLATRSFEELEVSA